MTMANGGGLVLVKSNARTLLRCPVDGCRFEVRLTDLGEMWDTGVTEDDLRAHLGTHRAEDWLRTLRAQQQTIVRLEEALAAVNVCPWCECPAGQCRALGEGQCCPDCEHTPPVTDEVVARCCALQAMEELAGGDHNRVREQLARAEADHAHSSVHDRGR